MKRTLLGLLRASRLLPAADRAMLLRSHLASRGRNRAFARSHPGVATPPPDLSFDAYHHVDRLAYLEGGHRHARVFADVLAGAGLAPGASILEWGCGPGRIIRHLPALLPSPVLTGADYNPRSIAWCQEHLPGIAFALNGLMPPLPFADASFDATYNFSVFTHLSEAAQLAWAADLRRVLKPGGLLVCSTHGDAYCKRLAGRDETARYAGGNLVVQSGYAEGKKWFLALHPPGYVRDRLLGAFTDVRSVPVGPEADMLQDLWVARKPAQDAAPGAVPDGLAAA